jgi:predicted lipid-binding transport protein (Tim44 family)
MKRSPILVLALAVLAITVATDDADARRLGGGRTFGVQRQGVTPPATSTGPAANPVLPAPSTASAAKAGGGAAAPPSPGSRWLGPIAGIAAGLGLAALLAHFGLPEGFASVLLLAFVVLGGLWVFRMLAARRSPATAAARASYGYSPGGPIERVEPALTPPPGPAAAPATGIPENFDRERFLREAKAQFRKLQAAWDAGDRKALSDVMTRDMASEILRELDRRGTHEATALLSLDADLLEVTTEAEAHWASVRFTGLVREDGAPQPVPLDEAWNLTKPVDGSSGWLLAGIRQLA